MAETINVLCYKSKTLSNGEHPLMIRICKNGKKKYVSLGLSVKAEHWNFEKNIPKPNCPNREHINILIANKKKEYEAEIVKLKSEDKLFTANTLNDRITSSVKPRTVEETFKEYISLLKEENRRGYMLSVQQVYNSLIKYNRHLDLLTSSTRTPKFICEQWSDTLMPFHKHSLIDSLLALRQCNLYSHYSFSKFEHLVHTHIYAG